MHREPLLQLLSRYRPWEEEGNVCERFVSFVKGHRDCFERSLMIGHITGSAWVVDPDFGQALLTHHVKLDKWLQLGGHADGDSNILLVALREVAEESGLTQMRPLMHTIFDLDIHEIPARAGEPLHHHFDVRFLVEANPDDPIKVTDESHDVRWVPFNEIEQLTTESSMLRMLKKAKEWRKSK